MGGGPGVTPQPSAQPPSVPGPGVGTPGTAQTASGPREGDPGRLAEADADFRAALAQHAFTAPDADHATILQSIAARFADLNTLVAALTEALDAVTHEYQPCCNGDGVRPDGGYHNVPHTPFCVADVDCHRPSDSLIHRTSARVRAEHGRDAT